ncbi:MAG TPA: anti-sigma factor [Candidatus Angelobacter sp.]|nr:anti-sigma factor [Candidatus Angelobacter sp.]
MKDHAQFAEDLALYAMGALDARNCPEMQAHLGECGECRRELEALRADTALLALSTAGPAPPQRARQRLMQAIAATPTKAQTAPRESGSGWPWPRWLFWAPLAASVLLAAFLVHMSMVHDRQVDALRAELQKERVDHARAQEIIAMMSDPKAEHMTLVAQRTSAQPQVKTIYVRDKGHVLVIANNLPQPPANMTYELWLLPADGKPMPCGTFKTDWRGHGMMLHEGAAGVAAKGFAVTMEPEAGSPWPTSEILLQPGQ